MMIALAIVVSEFNGEITGRMLEKAQEHAARLGARVRYVFHVPGAFDMPLAVERLLKKRGVDAVVTLGAVIKGDTRHDDIVAENVSRLISDLSLKHGKPVAMVSPLRQDETGGIVGALRGSVLRYDDPFAPAVEDDAWNALR